mmetsp:Transcript_15569/g.18742  ORF Transcript_15569/g.18742 Transcript_15569/m.18742 type:complete len:100 (+) Transcript_15569:610-909(+)
MRVCVCWAGNGIRRLQPPPQQLAPQAQPTPAKHPNHALGGSQTPPRAGEDPKEGGEGATPAMAHKEGPALQGVLVVQGGMCGCRVWGHLVQISKKKKNA